MTYDVVIIGAGVVGTLTARELSRYKLKVCVLEAESDVSMGASKANSAIVHGGYDPIPNTKKAYFNVKGAKMMGALCKELDVGYINNGSMVVAFDNDQLEHVKMLYKRGLDNGVEGLSVITGDEARKLEPNLSKEIVGALLCTSSGIVCPYNLAIAAMGNAMDNGCDLKTNFRVTDIVDDGSVYTFVSSKGEKVVGKYAVNCAGVYSDVIASLLGDKGYEIKAKKGEYMILDKSEGKHVFRTIFQTPTKLGKGILVTPTVDGNLLVGPTSVPADKEDTETTQAGLDTVKTVSALSCPNVNFRAVITSFSGERSSLVGGDDFIVEESKCSKRAVETIGIESPGLTSSPAIAEYIPSLLEKLGLKLEKNDKFNPNRVSAKHFYYASPEEKNQMIKEDSRYGRIICRCETVTEGEIVKAIHQNPKATTIDALKRRLRSSMGRCQGGFCTPFVSEILARELKVDETLITKFGDGSNLLIGKTK